MNWIARYCAGKFPAKTEVTIGVDFREKCLDIDGEQIKVITQVQNRMCILSKVKHIMANTQPFH